MLKRLMIVLLCLGVAILFTDLSFSQDEPVTGEDKKVEEKSDEDLKEAKKEAEVEPIKVVAEAKVYFDGKTTFVNSQVQFKLTSKDNLFTDKIEYKINEGEVKVYEGPFSLADEGTHLIAYYSIDKIGNIEDAKSYKVTVDNTPPAITVSSNKPVLKINDKTYISKDFKLSIEAKDTSSGVNKIEYSVNGTNYSEYVGPFSIPASGEFDLKVRALDNVNNLNEKFMMKIFDEAGNPVELTDESVKLSSDNVAPAVEIKADKEIKEIDAKKYASSDVKYTIAATDADSGVDAILYRIDGRGDFNTYAKEIVFKTNGEHKIEAKAVDKVGNTSSVASLVVYVDIIPPETTIDTVTKK